MNRLNAHEYIAGKLEQYFGLSESRAIAKRYLTDHDEFGGLHNKGLNTEVTEFSAAQLEIIDSDIEKILTGIPVQYVVGKEYFFGNWYQVNPSVLIPRPETEELLEIITQQNDLKPSTIIDLGTGSGCIAVSLKKMFPKAVVFATDISETALNTAIRNAELNQVDICFLIDNMTSSDIDAEIVFDLIVSNPPYVPNNESNTVDRHVILSEPTMAVFTGNDDATFFYKAIAAFAVKHLKKGGYGYVELNRAYGAETQDVFRSAGFTKVKLLKDLSGHDRFLGFSH